MYWADAGFTKIETAYLNGTGRRTLLTEPTSTYLAMELHDGNIYFTDLSNRYVCSLLSHAIVLLYSIC